LKGRDVFKAPEEKEPPKKKGTENDWKEPKKEDQTIFW